MTPLRGFSKWLVALALLASCPGMASSLCDLPATTPANLTGIDAPAPPRGEWINLRATVSARFLAEPGLNGFYVQAPAAGGRPAGVFVYAPELARRQWPQVGRAIAIAGRAGAYRGRVQFERIRSLADCGPGKLEPMPLDLPLTESAARRARDVLVRLRAPQPLIVTDNDDLRRYGSLGLALGERLFHPAAGVNGGAPAGIVRDEGAYRRNPEPSRYAGAAPGPRTGSRVGPVTAILARAFDAWRIHPAEPVRFRDTNPRLPAPARRGGTRVVGYNVENYFVTLDSRGPDDAAALRSQRQDLRAIVQGLRPDVLALQEVEKKPSAVRDLLATLNDGDAGAGPFAAAVVEQDRRGGVIRNDIVYREDRLDLLDVALLNDPVHTRAPIAASFSTRAGREFAVITVHFKSKGGCRADSPRGPDGGCWTGTRLRQAKSVSAWLPELRRRFGHDRLLLLGDLNSQPQEPPAQRLRAAGLMDLLARDVPPLARYTYVFAGRAGIIDHALSTPALSAPARAVIWHVNADEPERADREAGPWGQSDHDPVIVDLHRRDDGGS